ncbi:hypothetical protein [Paraburkholderia caledonica]|uniref:Uncharacterized protein n=1 Tax=Paraburkholderia caledonica TaxID=134536 RepID=A0AB73IPH2_9BURK|nr:hypothetical protein [Paraburkholderia caledonica]
MNCKPGDLAIMVDSRVIENIGVVFEVLGNDAEATAHYGHQCWRVRSSRPTRNSDGTMSIEGRAADFDLRPVSGLPVADDVTDDIKEPA